MNKKIMLSIAVFDPEGSLVNLLNNRGVEFNYQAKNAQVKVAMDETLDVVGSINNEETISILASIFVEWLQDKQYRKMQVQMSDGSIVFLEGYDAEGAANILNDSIKVTAFDPEYNKLVIRHRDS